MKLFAALAVVAGAAALAPHTDAQTGTVRFQTPSRNIGCLFSTANGRAGYLRCDILSGVRPVPQRSCELDWTGFAMTAISRASATCAGDTVYARGAPVIRYGGSWSRGGVTCTVRRAGLRCRNTRGRGFFLSRTRSYGF